MLMRAFCEKVEEISIFYKNNHHLLKFYKFWFCANDSDAFEALKTISQISQKSKLWILVHKITYIKCFAFEYRNGVASGHFLNIASDDAFRQCSSRATIMAARRDQGYDPWSIRQPRPPHQTGALASAGGFHIHRGGLLRHATFFNVKNQWQDPEI